MPSSLALAVDFGGTKVEAALIDPDARVVEGSRHRRPTGPTADSPALQRSVVDVVTAALAALPDGDEVVGVGIGSAGPIDTVHDAVSPLNVPAWRGHPLVADVRALVPGVPVVLAIDGLCIAVAEHWVGAGRGAGNLLGMVVSTGVGGGVLVGGRALPSPTGNAGHIGHIGVAGFDDRCACGGTGCLEAVASGPRTVAWARTQGFTGATGEDLAAAHAAGDPIALAAVERAGTAIGRAVASAANLLDLDLAAIGGGFSRVSPALLDHARAAVAEHTVFAFANRVRIVPSGLGDEGPLIGAAALIHRPEHFA
ncbi:ROK family protein [Agromyces sp. MMS24-K17]|uniref:ROK family protein n=1 Tax=Agromyces sp. MMS24-K17 TaxID=3372850 RepID=UPI0037545018